MAVTDTWKIPEDFGFQTVLRSDQMDDVSSRLLWLYNRMSIPHVFKPTGDTTSAGTVPGQPFDGVDAVDITLTAPALPMAMTWLSISANTMTEQEAYIYYRFTKGAVSHDMISGSVQPQFGNNRTEPLSFNSVGSVRLNTGVWSVRPYFLDTDTTSNDFLTATSDSTLLLYFVHVLDDRVHGATLSTIG